MNQHNNNEENLHHVISDNQSDTVIKIKEFYNVLDIFTSYDMITFSVGLSFFFLNKGGSELPFSFALFLLSERYYYAKTV